MKRCAFFVVFAIFCSTAVSAQVSQNKIIINYKDYKDNMWSVVKEEPCLRELLRTKDTTRAELIFLLHKIHFSQYPLNSFCDKNNSLAPKSLGDIEVMFDMYTGFYENVYDDVAQIMWEVPEIFENTVSTQSVLPPHGDNEEKTDTKKQAEIQNVKIKLPRQKLPYPINNIGHIVVQSFSQKDEDKLLLWKTLPDFQKQDVKGIVIDLRHNLGGNVVLALRFAGVFLGDRVVALHSIPFLNLYLQEYYGIASGLLWARDIPLVVMVDGYTGSSAEMVAGAFKYHKRALIVGDNTMGKGTEQVAITLFDETVFHITIGKWFLPDGTSIDNASISPDIYLSDYMPGNNLDSIVAELNGTELDEDPDLKKAFIILSTQIEHNSNK